MKKNIFGFTLIEILVSIAVIGLIIVATSKLTFNGQIDKQNSEMFTNNILTNIENIRNNALLGKGVGTSTIMMHPDSWNVAIVKALPTTQGTIQASYMSGALTFPYTEFLVNFINGNSKISNITCSNIDHTNTGSINTVTLHFTSKETSFPECSDPQYKILEIETSYKEFKNIIQINSITGVIQKL